MRDALQTALESRANNLQEAGTRINGRIHGNKIQLWIERPLIAGEMDSLQLRGTVCEMGESTLIRLSVSREHAVGVAPLLLVGIAAAVWWTGGSGAIPLMIFSLFVLLAGMIRRLSSRMDADASHLLGWVATVVGSVDAHLS